MIRRLPWILAACMGLTLLTGCGGEEQKLFDQARTDLEQGSYEYALSGFEACAANEVKLPESYRGAGIANLRMGNYEEAVENFTASLECENIRKALRKDVLSYRATCLVQLERYDEAMADCQSLAEEFDMNADTYYLTGKTALAMDAYGEASTNFEQAYGEEPGYDMAIRIYEAYVDRGMEADGIRYLEAALNSEPKSAEDYCDRGLAYYYMQDYDRAREELIRAADEESKEAVFLLGMVYLAQKDYSNARSMYQQFISSEENSARGYNGLALCDLAEGNYQAALEDIANGLSTATTEDLRSLLFNEIVAYERQLDFSTAFAKTKEYLEIFPGDTAAEKERVFLKNRIK